MKEKTFMSVLTMLTAGLSLFAVGIQREGFLWLSISCVFSSAILLIGSKIVATTEQVRNRRWLHAGMWLWFALMLVVGIYGPAFLAAESYICIVLCEAFSILNYTLVFVGAMFLLGKNRFKRRIHGAAVFGIGFATCLLGHILLFPCEIMQVTAVVMNAVAVLGLLVWLKGDDEMLKQCKFIALYPSLLILLVLQIWFTSMIVSRIVNKGSPNELDQKQVEGCND